MAERALDLMTRRSLSRTAFGKMLAEKVRYFILTQLLHMLCNSSIPNLQMFCTFVPSNVCSLSHYSYALCYAAKLVPRPILSGVHVDLIKK